MVMNIGKAQSKSGYDHLIYLRSGLFFIKKDKAKHK